MTYATNRNQNPAKGRGGAPPASPMASGAAYVGCPHKLQKAELSASVFPHFEQYTQVLQNRSASQENR